MAVKGEVTYELRADDSKLESDLEEAQKKVEQSTEKTADKIEQTEEKTSKTVKKEKEDVTDHHKQQNDERCKDDQETGKKREETEHETSEKIKSIASGTAKAIGAGMAAAAAGAVALGGFAVKSATDMDQAMNQFISSTGKSTEETQRYQNVLEDIYKNNYGESFEDIGDAMSQVIKQMGDMDDQSLQAVTESAYALRDTFEYEIPESTRAAKAMMDNFGVSGEEAMSLIAAGAQNGLDYSGELLDSISEYSVQFGKLGLSADDMFSIFQEGAESGAWNLDKIGDAVKEFSIRAIDGSETTKAGFKALGLNADETAAKFAAGGDTAKEAFQEVVKGLSEMEDPLAQNTAGVNLFGTMWEDLGPEAVAALASISDGAYDAAGAMDQIKEVKYDDLGSMFESLKRSVEMLALPLGEELLPILSELIEAVLPMVEEALPPLADAAGEMIQQLSPMIEELLPVLMDCLSDLLPPLMDIVNEILPVLTELFLELIPPIVEVAEALLPALLDIINALLPIIEALFPVLEPLIECFTSLLEPILALIEEALVPLLEALEPIIECILELVIPTLQILLSVFEEVFEGIVSSVSGQIQRVTTVMKELMAFIKNVFTGNWKAAWENVRKIFTTIAESIGEFFKIPINRMIDLINGFIDGLNKIKIPDWVPGFGGMSFNIPRIPRLRIGMDYVPEDDYPAFLHKGEAVLTAEENARLREIGGVWGLHSAVTAAPEVNDRMSRVMVENMAANEEIDYDRLGTAVADALIDGNVRFVIDGREYARLEKEIN